MKSNGIFSDFHMFLIPLSLTLSHKGEGMKGRVKSRVIIIGTEFAMNPD
jgi:hypothetical protein